MSGCLTPAVRRGGVTAPRPIWSRKGARFPNPVYAETVLAPLFEGVKTHFAAHMKRSTRRTW